jgi:hypothetical protein
MLILNFCINVGKDVNWKLNSNVDNVSEWVFLLKDTNFLKVKLLVLLFQSPYILVDFSEDSPALSSEVKFRR